jgi:hypothetical protein
MSAIDHKHLVEILSIIRANGISKKTGNPWEMYKAQCIVRGPDGVTKIGELVLPKALIDTPPGKYLAEFELDVSFERVVVPVVVNLHAWAAPAAEAPAGDAPALSPVASSDKAEDKQVGAGVGKEKKAA